MGVRFPLAFLLPSDPEHRLPDYRSHPELATENRQDDVASGSNSLLQPGPQREQRELGVVLPWQSHRQLTYRVTSAIGHTQTVVLFNHHECRVERHHRMSPRAPVCRGSDGITRYGPAIFGIGWDIWNRVC